jgi:hypothetical protein
MSLVLKNILAGSPVTCQAVTGTGIAVIILRLSSIRVG